MKAVEKLDHLFDSSKLLNEYLSLLPNNQLPLTYFRTIIFNKDSFLPIIQKTCPYIISVCETIRSVFDFNHVLIRLMPPYSNLSWHQDSESDPVAYHVPITTNPGCFFITDPLTISMQELGRLYQVHTHEFHTFLNAGDTPRAHLHCVHDNTGEYTKGDYLSWEAPFAK